MQITRRQTKRAFVASAWVIFVFVSSAAAARDLLPYPSQQMQASSSSQNSRLSEFERAVSGLDCNQLGNLRAQLAQRQRTADHVDQDYFERQIRIIEQRRNLRNCPRR